MTLRSVQGEERADDFDRFVRDHRGRLLGFLRHRVSSEDDAQDVAQESLVRLMRYRENPAETWSALLYRIAANVIVDRARRSQSHRAGDHVSMDDYVDIIVSPEPDAGQRLDTSRALEEVQKTLLRLPARCRDIYLLNRIEGMSYTEVAAHCGISVKSVEKHVSKALVALRKQVGQRMPSVAEKL